MDIADLVPTVSLELPGCPDMIVERVLREEMANLYRNHALWLRTAAVTLGTDGVVVINPPTNSEVHEIRSLRVGYDVLTPLGQGTVNSEEFERVGTPLVTFYRNYNWEVRPYPSEELTAEAVMQLGPLIDATTIPDTLASRHRTVWAHAVLSRMQGQSGQTWTNLRTASIHAAEFTRLVFEEKRRLDGWSSRRSPVVRYGGI